MDIMPGDRVLHLSMGDEAFGKADVFCGSFNKRQVANREYKPLSIESKKLPFQDKSFDYVYTSYFLQCVKYPMDLLNEIRRVGKKGHIKEHSEFSEQLFGWAEHLWVVTIENGELIIKEKNKERYERFGPYFHGLYQNDPVFFDYVSQNVGLMNIAVDWVGDEKVDDKLSFLPCQADIFEKNRMVLGRIKKEISIEHLTSKGII